LPYNPASTGRSITVTAIVVILDVSPSPPWTAGQTITLTAWVFSDERPVRGAGVSFYIRSPVDKLIGSGGTDIAGKCQISWTIPWKLDGTTIPCRSITLEAVSMGESDSRSGLVAYPTRLSISAPASVAVGEPFTISGKLEYESDMGVWAGLAGRTVSLYYDTTKIADVTTGSDGSYSKPDTIMPSPGTYTLKAEFAGEGLGLAPAVAGARLAVPEAVKPLIAPLAAMAVGGLAIALTAKR